MKPIIRVENLGKRYRIGQRAAPCATLRESLVQAAVSPINRLRRALNRNGNGSADSERHIWALKDVSFEVKPGEVVGIIGRNGAGKSTLLKILSRVTEPTEGKVDLYGRVGSLLEVGTGFHPELTGRENIYLNGAILGMRRSEIARKFDEIVAFAEVEKFIDTPVKRFSSGMYMRLAFAVAAHLEPEILVVDEVLAVGDMEFQKKCLGKMGEVAKGGRTVLFVSHNMHAIKSLCTQGILLQAGRVFFDGSALASVSKYLYLDQASAGTGRPFVALPVTRAGSGEWRFTEVAATKSIFDPAEPKEFTFQISPTRPDAGPIYLSGSIVNEEGTTLTQLDSRLTGFLPPSPQPIGGRLWIAGPWLKPGLYILNMYICSICGIIDWFDRSAAFEVSPMLPYPQTASSDSTASALVLADFAWSVDR
jgi:lipopolysaccharide transport system ATP-binding protein